MVKVVLVGWGGGTRGGWAEVRPEPQKLFPASSLSLPSPYVHAPTATCIGPVPPTHTSLAPTPPDIPARRSSLPPTEPWCSTSSACLSRRY